MTGTLPNSQNLLNSNLPALETTTSPELENHLSTMYSARRAFMKAESSEKIRRAIRHPVRSCEQMFQNGGKVFFLIFTLDLLEMVIACILQHQSYYEGYESLATVLRLGVSLELYVNTEVHSDQPFSNHKLCDKEIKDAEKLFLVVFPHNATHKQQQTTTVIKEESKSSIFRFSCLMGAVALSNIIKRDI